MREARKRGGKIEVAQGYGKDQEGKESYLKPQPLQKRRGKQEGRCNDPSYRGHQIPRKARKNTFLGKAMGIGLALKETTRLEPLEKAVSIPSQPQGLFRSQKLKGNEIRQAFDLMNGAGLVRCG
jgi:hypothetical protein